MSNSINWMDSKSVHPGTPRPAQRPAGQTAPAGSGEYVPQYTTPLPVTPAPVTPTPLTPAQQADLMGMESTAFQQGPPPATEQGFIPYYLTRNLGKSVRAEFVIGSGQYIDKSGILIEVGINYFVLEDVNSRTHIMCDLYSMKFMTILHS